MRFWQVHWSEQAHVEGGGWGAHNLLTPERMQLLMEISMSCVLEPAGTTAAISHPSIIGPIHWEIYLKA